MADEELHTIENVEIFATGTHNGDRYTTKDLDDMVDSFGKVGFNVPLKAAHNWTESDVALGWIENLRRKGSKLVADFTNIPESVFATIKRRGWDAVSSEIFFDIERNKKTFRRVLKAVGLLGISTPAVTLKPLHKLEFSETGDTFRTYEYKPQEEDMELKEMAEKIESLEKERDELKSTNGRGDITVQIAKLQADIITGHEDYKKNSEELIKTLSNELKENKTKTEEIAKTLRDDKIKSLSAKLKIPALRPHIEALFSVVSEVTKTVKFSAKSGEKEEETSAEKVIESFIDALNKQAERLFGQNAKVNAVDRENETSEEDIGEEVDKRIQKYIKDNKLDKVSDYSEAMRAVLDADEDLKTAYAAN